METSHNNKYVFLKAYLKDLHFFQSNIIYVFTVTFGHFNASLLNKYMNSVISVYLTFSQLQWFRMWQLFFCIDWRIEIDLITPELASLHWLPGSFWIDFTMLFIFKDLYGLAPQY